MTKTRIQFCLFNWLMGMMLLLLNWISNLETQNQKFVIAFKKNENCVFTNFSQNCYHVILTDLVVIFWYKNVFILFRKRIIFNYMVCPIELVILSCLRQTYEWISSITTRVSWVYIWWIVMKGIVSNKTRTEFRLYLPNVYFTVWPQQYPVDIML